MSEALSKVSVVTIYLKCVHCWHPAFLLAKSATPTISELKANMYFSFLEVPVKTNKMGSEHLPGSCLQVLSSAFWMQPHTLLNPDRETAGFLGIFFFFFFKIFWGFLFYECLVYMYISAPVPNNAYGGQKRALVRSFGTGVWDGC